MEPMLRLIVLSVVAATTVGCATTAASSQINPADHVAAEQSNSETTERSHLSLSQIEPAVVCPTSADTLEPLSERAAKQVAKANDLIAEMRYTEAALALQRALRFEPKHPEIHVALAKLHWHAGNLERARVHAAKVLERVPDHPVAQYLMGRWYLSQGDSQLAMKSFRLALACSKSKTPTPETVLCNYHLARVLTDQGYWLAALQAYDTFERLAYDVAETSNNPELVNLVQRRSVKTARARSALLVKLNRLTEAADALEPLLPSDDVSLALHQASLFLRASQPKRALRAMAQVDADDRRIVDLLFDIYDAMGKPEQTIVDVRARLERDGTKSALRLALADLLVKLNQTREAVLELRTYLKTNPGADVIRTKLVDYAVGAKDWTQVLEVCAESLAQGTSQATIFEHQIRQLAKDQDAAEALLAERQDASFEVLYLQGLVADSAGFRDKAEKLLNQCLQIKPDSIAVRVALARVYLDTFDYDSALTVASGAKDNTDVDGRLSAMLAQIYDRLDQFDQVELHAKAAIQRDRTDFKTKLLLAKLYYRYDKPRQAQQQLRAMVDQDPQNEQARELLASIYFEQQKIDAAIAEYDELRQVSSNPLTRARCSAFLKQFPNYDAKAYRKELLDAINRHGSDTPTWLAIASTYEPFMQADLQRDAYLKALESDPDNEEALIGLTQANRHTLRFEKAIDLLKQLLKRRPNRLLWQRLLIDSYWTVRDFDAALVMVRAKLDQEDIDKSEKRRYRFLLLQTLDFAEREDEIVAAIKSWLEEKPDSLEWAIQLSNTYVRQEKFDQAFEILKPVYAKRSSARDQLLPRLISALIESKRYDQAVQYALDWIYDDPTNDGAISLLATVLAQSDRLDEGLELIRSRLLQTDRREALQNRWIVLLQTAGRHDECIELLDSLIDSLVRWFQLSHDDKRDHREIPALAQRRAFDPDPPYSAPRFQERYMQLRINLAIELISAQRFRQAEKLLLKALNEAQTQQERYEYQRRLAFCYQVMGRDEQAEHALAQALAILPTSVGLNNDLAYGLIDRGVRLDEAEKMIRFALAKAPRQAAYLDTFGWLLYKKGKLTEAKTWLSRSDESRSDNDPVVLDHLGDTCWRLGQQDEAIAYWQRAVKAVSELPEAQIQVADMLRVSHASPAKIEAAQAGEKPSVAELGQGNEQSDDDADRK